MKSKIRSNNNNLCVPTQMYLESSHKMSRVKAVAFRPDTRSILMAHYNGDISLFDMQLNIVSKVYNAHVGPVRALSAIHTMFASGGDDCRVRVWDYADVICSYSHHDYVRSVSFHPYKPLVASGSDDQSIKVFNFQSKKVLYTLVGHTHYVMGVAWMGNLLLSCSLDQTVRLWHRKSICHIVEAHNRGICGLSVCDNRFMTVSDDCETKLWEVRVNGEKYVSSFVDDVRNESPSSVTVDHVETYYHHNRPSSGALLRNNSFITVGEDGLVVLCSFGIRGVKRYSLDGSRLWCVDGDEKYFAVGHDDGVLVFSYERPFPAIGRYTERISRRECDAQYFIYSKGTKIFRSDFSSESEIFTAKREPIRIQYNRNAILIQYTNSFDLISNSCSPIFSGKGEAALSKRFLAYIYKGLVTVLSLSKEEVDTIRIDAQRICIWEKKSPIVIASKANVLSLLGESKVLRSISFDFTIRDVVINNDLIAVVGEHDILVINHELVTISSSHELPIIRSCIPYVMETDKNDEPAHIFLYSTARQVKFISAQKGVINSLDDAYLINVVGEKLFYYSDRISSMDIDFVDMRFKHFKDVQKIIESGDLIGLAPIYWLIENDKGDIALNLVKDKMMRYSLLLSVGKYDETYDVLESIEKCDKSLISADNEINESSFDMGTEITRRLHGSDMKTDLYVQLARASIKDGCADVAEKCFKKIGAYYDLFLLYVITNKRKELEDLYEKSPLKTKIIIGRYLDKKLSFTLGYESDIASCGLEEGNLDVSSKNISVDNTDVNG